jgi:uncharacterized protein (DUF58 family)
LIYPTRRLILLAASIAPLALVIGILVPAYWFAGLALIAFLLALAGADTLTGAPLGSADFVFEGPVSVSVGAGFEIALEVRFARSAPAAAEAAVDEDPLIEAAGGHRRRIAIDDGAGFASLAFTARRRGTARLERCWLRWRGPLGLVWKQKKPALEQTLLITPDIRPVRTLSAQMLSRDSIHGLIAQRQAGEGAEFDSLTEYRPGMDRRSIDWKTSARHTGLIAKEYRTERNNHIVLALDSGRAMCEPLAGLPRIDRAVSAALLTAFVALKEGDRVGLFGFDSRPRLSSAPVSGGRSFALLQRLAAGLDYSASETNYTLGLTTLAAGLHRRSLIIVFTEFTDTVSAELMLNALGALLKRHLVLFIVLRDEELETLAAREPCEADDVARAITAAALLRERRLVVTRLRHLGARIVETDHENAGPALVGAYLDLKRRNAL